jgi:hypothetical protein
LPQGFLRPLAFGDIFREDYEGADPARTVMPRQNVPSKPLRGTIGPVEAVIFFA